MIKTLGLALAGLSLAAPAAPAAPALMAATTPKAPPPVFTLRSPNFANGKPLGTVNEYNGAGSGCHGGNKAPTLTWSGEPAGTRSFAVYVYDPDAKPNGWVHWFVYNIPAKAHKLTDASAPTYTLGATSFGKAKYGGPCPPLHDKAHHYYFTLIALRVAHVNAPRGAALDRNQFIRATGPRWIKHVSIIGTFRRP
jgi:Raf kinase inhibitor-like YbhB/YbcL family protein